MSDEERARVAAAIASPPALPPAKVTIEMLPSGEVVTTSTRPLVATLGLLELGKATLIRQKLGESSALVSPAAAARL